MFARNPSLGASEANSIMYVQREVASLATIEEGVDVRELSEQEAHEVLDRAARFNLGLTGEEFVRAWEAGDFDSDPDRPEVMRVAMLLPFGR
jgi:hypothetical protein